MAKCYILASVSNVLQTQHATIGMASLENMFERSTRSTRQVALRGVCNTNMGKDSRVRDHELKMAKYLNEAQIQQAQIDDETKIDMVLESLPDAFNEFKVNYNLNMMKLTMVELMNGLYSAEEI